ncbi:MAG TPA: hypothetical protein VOB72_18365 [Candidatus Dormibacteraeota bacterium]|nr:hypothetical protein [Candidatus Dormibacteraeota bacterium]
MVAALEALRRENQQLSEDNARLRAQLAEIGSALGRLSGAPRGRRGATTTQDAAPRRRRPITDPAALERRRAALVKARAARAEKLAAARAETATA